jgi:hypothetical protein
MYVCFVPYNKHAYGPPRSVIDGFNLSYVDDVRTSQETRLWASAFCYGDGFTFLYVDNVRTSQETRLHTSTICCGDGFFICR